MVVICIVVKEKKSNTDLIGVPTGRKEKVLKTRFFFPQWYNSLLTIHYKVLRCFYEKIQNFSGIFILSYFLVCNWIFLV
jgi:hypothetical protein